MFEFLIGVFVGGALGIVGTLLWVLKKQRKFGVE
jgi:hypothetical protein